jgi:hypothetical protein
VQTRRRVDVIQGKAFANLRQRRARALRFRHAVGAHPSAIAEMTHGEPMSLCFAVHRLSSRAPRIVQIKSDLLPFFRVRASICFIFA